MVKITKANGKVVPFKPQKLQRSLRRAGASSAEAREIVEQIKARVKNGESTKNIYSQAFRLLKKMENNIPAVRYSLKEAIRALGPTGYPFEQFIGRLFEQEGYNVAVGQVLPGKCVTHEMDVVAMKENEHVLVEAKFRNKAGDDVNVRVPLYMHARFADILANEPDAGHIHRCVIVTNGHFTDHAIQYASCIGDIDLLGWRYPAEHGLAQIIESSGLHPVTILSSLTSEEQRALLARDIVTCRDLMNTSTVLQTIGLSQRKASTVMAQVQGLCNAKVVK